MKTSIIRATEYRTRTPAPTTKTNTHTDNKEATVTIAVDETVTLPEYVTHVCISALK